jgi:primosomal protein N'
VLLTLSAKEEGELRQATAALDQKIRDYKKRDCPDLPFALFGPFEAPLYRVKDTFRMRFVIKSKNCKALRGLICRLMAEFTADYKQKITLNADMNPSAL